MVLYFGTKERWTAPKNLCSCFEIPEDLRPFVSDYKINVFEIAWLDDETISKFQSDFKFVAKYFQSKRLNTEYKPTNDEIKHVDALLKMFAVLTGDKYFETIYNEGNFKEKGGVAMCDIVQGFVKQGRDEGKADVIRKMLDAKALTAEQIASILKLPVEEVREIAQKVPEMA